MRGTTSSLVISAYLLDISTHVPHAGHDDFVAISIRYF